MKAGVFITWAFWPFWVLLKRMSRNRGGNSYFLFLYAAHLAGVRVIWKVMCSCVEVKPQSPLRRDTMNISMLFICFNSLKACCSVCSQDDEATCMVSSSWDTGFGEGLQSSCAHMEGTQWRQGEQDMSRVLREGQRPFQHRGQFCPGFSLANKIKHCELSGNFRGKNKHSFLGWLRPFPSHSAGAKFT